jgi:hypothetical protein
LTGRGELPSFASAGGWISLIAFAILAYCLIRIPLRKKA